MRFEPIKGYSVPVVRCSESGRVLFTLSFTPKGRAINPPQNINPHTLDAAWEAWIASQ